MSLSVAVTPDTLATLDTLAAQRGVSRSAVVRDAIEQAVSDSGGPSPIFPPTALGQRWPQRQQRLPGIASRVQIGLRLSRWTQRFPSDEGTTER